MKYNIIGRKVNLRDNFKERVYKKLGKFEKIFADDSEATVTVTVEKNRQTVEVTIRDNGMTYRAESTALEMNDALDSVVDILGGQIRKNKTKLSKKLRAESIEQYFAEFKSDEEAVEDEYNVVRTKTFTVKPLSVEEAILQMNMIGHEFFMFLNSNTNQICVVYKRKDNTYGLLEPEY
ncbi:MAG: ribosome-associated translation inhibitor RaiA [Clostridia bacterium]|nr:ribosome-associated translation inhibitor RaiA [Clostridia bacterium]